MAIYERPTKEDTRHAADALCPVYDATRRYDGRVSLEGSSYLATNRKATVVEECRLWKAVDRENLMIKVPATKAGPSAIYLVYVSSILFDSAVVIGVVVRR